MPVLGRATPLDPCLGTCRAGVSRMFPNRLVDTPVCDIRIHKPRCLQERLESTASRAIGVACEKGPACLPLAQPLGTSGLASALRAQERTHNRSGVQGGSRAPQLLRLAASAR